MAIQHLNRASKICVWSSLIVGQLITGQLAVAEAPLANTPQATSTPLIQPSLATSSPSVTPPFVKPITKTVKPSKADWTPVLKTMQNGCDLPDFENVPPNLLASVTLDNTAKRQKMMGDYKQLTLNNAVAWGLPITKIQFGSAGAGFSSATVYFTDARFMKLRDKFYIQTASGKLKASDKTIISDRNAFAGQYFANGVGYNDGRVGVNFSKKTNSITCSWAHLTS